MSFASALLLGACASSGLHAANPDARAQFERLKQLAGTWSTPRPADVGNDTVRYTVTAGGSALLEEMFPGDPNGMLTLYHLDGPDLVLTHYCSAGNQPRMRALPSEPDGTIPFAFDGGTNVDPDRDGHMHALRVRVDGPNAARAEWTYNLGGKPDHTTVFELKRGSGGRAGG